MALGVRDAISQETVDQWFVQFDDFLTIPRTCFPMAELESGMVTLTEKQIRIITENLNLKRATAWRKLSEKSREQRDKLRVMGIEKASARIGFDLAGHQKRAIVKRVGQHISTLEPYGKVMDDWVFEFNNVLKVSVSSREFSLLWPHVNSIWVMQQINNKEIYTSNRNNTKAAIFELIGSMSSVQRATVSKWIGKLSRSIRTVSQTSYAGNSIQDYAYCGAEGHNVK